MKRIISAAVALGAICASPVLAETWVHAATTQGTYQSGKAWDASKKRVVHHVDIGSIVNANGLRYFNRKITHYKLQGDDWRYQFKIVAGNSRADCSKKALMIAASDEDGEWRYRRSNGEWWTESQIANGSRVKGVGIETVRLIGYNTHKEKLAANDRFASGFYKLVCGN